LSPPTMYRSAMSARLMRRAIDTTQRSLALLADQ
jgi:hypothetical protein